MFIGKTLWTTLCSLSLFLCLPSLSAETVKADSLIQKAQAVMYANPKQATYFAEKALELLPEKVPDATRAEALLAIGKAYTLLGDFDISVKTLYDALHYCPTEDNGLLSEIQMQMADAYCRLKDYTKAFEINDKAATLCKIHQDSTGLAATYNTRGIIHYNLNECKSRTDAGRKVPGYTATRQPLHQRDCTTDRYYPQNH